MAKTQGKVHSIISNLVLVKVEGPVSQNEICFIEENGERLMAEVIKVVGDLAYVQVFESTRGLKPGMPVEFQNHMLEVSLGPGLLSKNFDGLQNDLDKMTGVFLKRGEYTNPLEDDKKWSFTPLAKAGDKVKAADWLGNVKENWLDHKIMVPFKLEGEYTVVSVLPAGEYTIFDTIAVMKDRTGKEINVTMVQKWPVKVAIRNYVDKPRPFRQMETGVRVIDTMNPMLEGGTGFIPGPFGTGKTVLQHALARFADADVIIRSSGHYESSFPLQYRKKEYTGRKKTCYYVILGNKRITFGHTGDIYEEQDVLTKEMPLKLTENFYLPVSFGKSMIKEYISEEVIYTEREAQEKAQQELSLIFEKLSRKRLQIIENNVKIESNGVLCRASGTYVTEENAVQEQTPRTELPTQDDPEEERERTSSDITG